MKPFGNKKAVISGAELGNHRDCPQGFRPDRRAQDADHQPRRGRNYTADESSSGIDRRYPARAAGLRPQMGMREGNSFPEIRCQPRADSFFQLDGYLPTGSAGRVGDAVLDVADKTII